MKRCVLTLGMLVGLTACTSDGAKETPTEQSSGRAKLVTFEVTNPQQRATTGQLLTMLSFNSWQDFVQTAEELNQIVDSYEESFVQQWADLSDDELNEKEEQIGFNAQQPLIDFERSIGFNNALRHRYNREEAVFLETDLENPSLDPDVTLPFSGGALSLVNDKLQVMIGNEIYAHTNQAVYIIKGDYITNLGLFNAGLFRLLEQAPKVSVIDIDTPTKPRVECTGWKTSNTLYDNVSGNTRVKLLARIRSYPVVCFTEKISVNYKKNKKGKWKTERTNMKLSIGQALLDHNCENVKNRQYKGYNAFRKRTKRVNSITVYGNLRLKAPQGGVYGEHRHHNRTVYCELIW